MGYTTWAPAEVAYLNELVDQYGDRGRWDEIRERMHDRFGSIRPYRKMRLDLRYRQLNDRRQQAIPVEKPVPQQRTTALEALLGKPQRSSSGNDSAAGKENIPSRHHTRRESVSLISVPRAEGNLPELSADKDLGTVNRVSLHNGVMDTQCIPASVLSDQKNALLANSTPNKHWLRSSPEPVSDQVLLFDESRILAHAIVHRHLYEPRQSRQAQPKQPTPRGGRPYTSEEKTYLAELAAHHGTDWMTIAFMMQERFGNRRIYTNTSVKTAHRRYSAIASRDRPLAEKAKAVSAPVVVVDGMPSKVKESSEFVKRRRLSLGVNSADLTVQPESESRNISSQTTEGSNVASSDSMAICTGPEVEPEQQVAAQRPAASKSGNCVVQ